MISFHLVGMILQFDPVRMADLSTTVRLKHTDNLLTVYNDTERIGDLILDGRDAAIHDILPPIRTREYTVVSGITNILTKEITLISTTINILYEPESVEFADDAYISIEVVSLRDDKGDTENDHSN